MYADMIPDPTVCSFSIGLTGSVSPLYKPGVVLRSAGVVAGHDLTTEAALTKLSYLLALSDLTQEEVTKQMASPLLGELTEQSKMIFKHPGCDVLARQTNLTCLGYAIADGDLNQVNDIMEASIEWLLNEGDYIGNTPLVKSPIRKLCFFYLKSTLT